MPIFNNIQWLKNIHQFLQIFNEKVRDYSCSDYTSEKGDHKMIAFFHAQFAEGFTYDKNGNIDRTWRSALDATLGLTLQDNMGYSYNWTSNRLNAVGDGSAATALGDAGNSFFGYDAIGQLTSLP